MTPLPYIHINGPTTAIKPSASITWIIFMLVLVIWSLFSLRIPYRQKTIFPVAEHTSIILCSVGLFLGRWGVVNIGALWHLERCRAICKICRYPIVDIRPSIDERELYESILLSTTPSWSGLNGSYDSYVLSGVWYSPFNIWQHNTVADILYMGLQHSRVKLWVLAFFAIIKPLWTQWVYERALSLALADRNLLVDNWLLISSYWYEESPIPIVSHYEHITLMT
jgi:hypothetical protein